MSKKILVPVDLSDAGNTRSVITGAIEQWQKVDNPQLIVMSVVPDMVAGLDWRYAIRGETGGSQDWDMRKIVAGALKHLNKIVSDLVPEGIQVQTIVRHGTAYEEVLRVAEELEVDQIVVGAHRPSASDFLIGPNTARIVRHATCSVTVLRG